MKPLHKTGGALAAIALLAAPLAALAQSGEAARGVYAKAGFLGVGLGYAHSIDERFGLRADFSTIGSMHRNGSSGGLSWRAKAQANQLGAYADFFPLHNSFRLSGGMQLRSVKLEGDVRSWRIRSLNNTVFTPDGPQDAVRATIKYPTVAPYLGLGWGHHASRAKGWGAVFDLGVSLRGAKSSLYVSDSVYRRIDDAARRVGSTADAEIEEQRRELKDKADDLKILPQVYIGVSYRF